MLASPTSMLRSLHQLYPIAKGTAAVVLLPLSLCFACGRVDFGEDLVPSDSSSDVDLGGEVDADVDAMVPDADGGIPLDCLPVDLPTQAPQAWPFELSEEGYSDVFWSWATEQGGCSGPEGSLNCHGGLRAPFIPFEDDLSERFQEGIDALYPLVRDAEPLDPDAPPTGALWRHASGHPDRVSPLYIGPIPARLNALIAQARACSVAQVIENPPDTGVAECTEEPDIGADVDAGSDDVVDAGLDGGTAAVCYCPVPDAGNLMTMFCAL